MQTGRNSHDGDDLLHYRLAEEIALLTIVFQPSGLVSLSYRILMELLGLKIVCGKDLEGVGRRLIAKDASSIKGAPRTKHLSES